MNNNKLMKIVNETGKEIEWSQNNFPDGQVQLKIHKDYKADLESGVRVAVSLVNPMMLDLFNQLFNMATVLDFKVNYLYGARSDKDESGDMIVCNVADLILEKLYSYWIVAYGNVTSKILNSGFKRKCYQIEILAPHCNIDGSKCQYYLSNYNLPQEVNLDDYDMIVFPDESAQRRFSYINKPYIICEKEREQSTGKIIKHIIPELQEGVKKVIVIDDLADACGTFISVIDTLQSGVKADLFIFHGIFTNNAVSRVLQKFNHIFVTNSLTAGEEQRELLSPEDQSRVTIIDVWN